jgi:hypothetical protein
MSMDSSLVVAQNSSSQEGDSLMDVAIGRTHLGGRQGAQRDGNCSVQFKDCGEMVRPANAGRMRATMTAEA